MSRMGKWANELGVYVWQKGEEEDEDRNITYLSYYNSDFLCSCFLVPHHPISIVFCIIIIHYFAFQFRSPEF